MLDVNKVALFCTVQSISPFKFDKQEEIYCKEWLLWWIPKLVNLELLINVALDIVLQYSSNFVIQTT